MTDLIKTVLVQNRQIKGGGGGGGVQAFRFRKNDFELGIGGDGQDTSGHFEGYFRSIRAILPM